MPPTRSVHRATAIAIALRSPPPRLIWDQVAVGYPSTLTAVGSKNARHKAKLVADHGGTAGPPPPRPSGGRNPRGYNFRIRVTSGHESEAKAAQLRKKPSRFGMLVLRLLGYRGGTSR